MRAHPGYATNAPDLEALYGPSEGPLPANGRARYFQHCTTCTCQQSSHTVIEHVISAQADRRHLSDLA